jgi:hypothetical protein
MQINSVLAGRADTMASGKRSDPIQAAGATALDATGQRATSSVQAASATAQIMADYDLNDVSPQKFSEMLQRLHDAGALGDQEFRELAQVRLDMDQAGLEADNPTDVLKFCAQKSLQLQGQLAVLGASGGTPAQRAALQQSVSAQAKRIDWLQKLDLVHDAPDTVALDLTA